VGNGTFKIDVQELNTEGASNNVTAEDDWKVDPDLLSPFAKGLCGWGFFEYFPIGVAVFQGDYALSNFTAGKPLALLNPASAETCTFTLEPIPYWVFNASSSYATGPFVGGRNITYSVSVSGYWGGGSSASETFRSFQGLYSVVATDEWGAVAIEHFQVPASST
jgi:hypothetical protein